MSVARGLAQPLTRNLVAISSTVIFGGANLLAQFTAAAGFQQVGSLVVAPSISALQTAVAAAVPLTAAAAGINLIDLGKTITIRVADGLNNNASIKMREVKLQNFANSGNSAVPFYTGYVVVENNFNGGIVSSTSELFVTVARV